MIGNIHKIGTCTYVIESFDAGFKNSNFLNFIQSQVHMSKNLSTL